MFRWLPTVALIALLFAVGTASAQLDGDPLLNDPANDVVMTAADAAEQDTDRAPAVDLIHLWMDEDSAGFWFRVEVRDAEPDDELPMMESGPIHIYLTHEDHQYRIMLLRTSFLSTFTFASLQLYNAADGNWATVRTLDLDLEGNQFTTFVPREALRDGNGVAPLTGRILTDIRVHAEAAVGFFCSTDGCTYFVKFEDHMPDVGGNHATWEVIHGIQQTGHAHLASEIPLRASNGEATTFVFEVDARNEGDQRDRFTFQVRGAPSLWDVRLPVPLLDLEGESNATVPILVTMPFNHQHGVTETFIVEMTSQNDPRAVGRVELGVHFLEIPQPTGHHPEVYLHSMQWEGDPVTDALLNVLPGGSWAFMNAKPDDPLSDGVPVPGWSSATIASIDGQLYTSLYHWAIPLTPTLQIGMDFDLDGTGHIVVPFRADGPLIEADLYVRLIHSSSRDGQNWIVTPLLNDKMEVGTVTPGGTFTYEAEFQMPAEADYLPFQRHQGLNLVFQLGSMAPNAPFFSPGSPELLPGGVMRLPLNEYSDPVSDTFAALADLSLRPEGPQEKPVNPGKTVILRAKLQNDMDHHMGLDLELSGPNGDWAHIVGSPVAHLDPGGNRIIEVAVQAPEGARHGERADLILTASSHHDEAMRTLVRLVAHVDTQNEHADEADLIMEEAEHRAPAVGAVALIGLTAALAMVRRRF